MALRQESREGVRVRQSGIALREQFNAQGTVVKDVHGILPCSNLARLWQRASHLTCPANQAGSRKTDRQSPQPHRQGSGTVKVRLSRRESIFGGPGSGKR